MRKLWFTLFAALLLSSISANVLLMKQNSLLTDQLLSDSTQFDLPENTILEPLRGKDLTGAAVIIDPKQEGRPVVLFVLSPSCHVCVQNWPAWNSILATRENDKWTPVFLNVGPLLQKPYINEHGLSNFKVLNEVSKNTADSCRLFSTPRTILLDRNGAVRDTWTGVLSPDDVKEFQRKLISLDAT